MSGAKSISSRRRPRQAAREASTQADTSFERPWAAPLAWDGVDVKSFRNAHLLEAVEKEALFVLFDPLPDVAVVDVVAAFRRHRPVFCIQYQKGLFLLALCDTDDVVGMEETWRLRRWLAERELFGARAVLARQTDWDD